MVAPQQTPLMSPDNIGDTLGGTIEQMEVGLYQQIQDIQSNGSPDPLQLAALQMNMQTWETVLSTWSSIIKAEGDTSKQIANNMGS